jgi:hypothetical protein
MVQIDFGGQYSEAIYCFIDLFPIHLGDKEINTYALANLITSTGHASAAS